ncbi:hypothetical protein BISU_3020 [Bifidobacterium subtile]|uniref:Uncharacterized protein n=1 Tax=Bifidobacterium subtile TaxID=77635 RepID=A0A087DTI8_9BIFI|nr:hypothetical protein BISU_3020 [Bifidobacterium subtile]
MARMLRHGGPRADGDKGEMIGRIHRAGARIGARLPVRGVPERRRGPGRPLPAPRQKHRDSHAARWGRVAV